MRPAPGLDAQPRPDRDDGAEAHLGLEGHVGAVEHLDARGRALGVNLEDGRLPRDLEAVGAKDGTGLLVVAGAHLEVRRELRRRPRPHLDLHAAAARLERQEVAVAEIEVDVDDLLRVPPELETVRTRVV
jgi:hypothetical protein